MLVLDEKTFVYGIWFIPGENCDWLASLSKVDGEHWVFRNRLRIYRDDKAFDSDDIKEGRAYQGQPHWTMEEAVANVQKTIAVAREQFGNEGDFVDLQCYGHEPKVMFELGSRDWSGMRLATEADKAAMGY